MNTLDITIIGPAFAAGALTLSTHVILGREVLRRGIIFLDLAIAQFAGAGLIAAAVLGLPENGIFFQLIALTCALLGAILLGGGERHFHRHHEALIGITFVLAATASILLMAHNPHAGEYLQELLVGQILWTEWQSLWWPLLVNGTLLLLLVRFPSLVAGFAFYPLFALAITVSVQLVGIYLVFASLIIPALATFRCAPRIGAAGAFAIGICGYAAGLLLSTWTDLPAGALIVWCLAASAALAYGAGFFCKSR